MKTLCRPVLVESKEYNKLRLDNNNKLTFEPHVQGLHYSGLIHTYQQLVLISLNLDDKIEEGDLVYRHYEDGGSHIGLATPKADELKRVKDNRVWKVITDQNQLSPEYIQQFIEEYNKDEVKDVEIEMESWTVYSGDHQNTPRIYSPKLTDGFITIVEKKPILYTEEEIENKFKQFAKELSYKVFIKECKTQFDFIDFSINWFEQNKKK